MWSFQSKSKKNRSEGNVSSANNLLCYYFTFPLGILTSQFPLKAVTHRVLFTVPSLSDNENVSKGRKIIPIEQHIHMYVNAGHDTSVKVIKKETSKTE